MYGKKQMQEVKTFAMSMWKWLIPSAKEYYAIADEQSLVRHISWMTDYAHPWPEEELFHILKGNERAKAKSRIQELLKNGYQMIIYCIIYKNADNYLVTLRFRGPEAMYQKKLAYFQSGNLCEARKVPWEVDIDFVVPVGELLELSKAIHRWAK